MLKLVNFYRFQQLITLFFARGEPITLQISQSVKDLFASVLSPEAWLFVCFLCYSFFSLSLAPASYAGYIFCFGTIGTIGTFPPDLYRSVLESTSVQSRSILESTSIDKLSLGSFLTRLSLSTQTFYRLFSDVLPVQNFSSAIFYLCVLCYFFLSFC